MLNEIVTRSFECNEGSTIGVDDRGEVIREHKNTYKIIYEDNILEAVLLSAGNLGYKTELFQQTHADGSNGHLRIKKEGQNTYARITSEKIDQKIVYRLYIPYVDKD